MSYPIHTWHQWQQLQQSQKFTTAQPQSPSHTQSGSLSARTASEHKGKHHRSLSGQRSHRSVFHAAAVRHLQGKHPVLHNTQPAQYAAQPAQYNPHYAWPQVAQLLPFHAFAQQYAPPPFAQPQPQPSLSHTSSKASLATANGHDIDTFSHYLLQRSPTTTADLAQSQSKYSLTCSTAPAGKYHSDRTIRSHRTLPGSDTQRTLHSSDAVSHHSSRSSLHAAPILFTSASTATIKRPDAETETKEEKSSEEEQSYRINGLQWDPVTLQWLPVQTARSTHDSAAQAHSTEDSSVSDRSALFPPLSPASVHHPLNLTLRPSQAALAQHHEPVPPSAYTRPTTGLTIHNGVFTITNRGGDAPVTSTNILKVHDSSTAPSTAHASRSQLTSPERKPTAPASDAPVTSPSHRSLTSVHTSTAALTASPPSLPVSSPPSRPFAAPLQTPTTPRSASLASLRPHSRMRSVMKMSLDQAMKEVAALIPAAASSPVTEPSKPGTATFKSPTTPTTPGGAHSVTSITPRRFGSFSSSPYSSLFADDVNAPRALLRTITTLQRQIAEVEEEEESMYSLQEFAGSAGMRGVELRTDGTITGGVHGSIIQLPWDDQDDNGNAGKSGSHLFDSNNAMDVATVMLSSVLNSAGVFLSSAKGLRSLDKRADSRLIAFGLNADQAETLLKLLHHEDCSVFMSLIESTPSYSVQITTLPSDSSNASQLQQFVNAVLVQSNSDAPPADFNSLPLLYQLAVPLYKAQAVELAERIRDFGGEATLVNMNSGSQSLQPSSSRDNLSAVPAFSNATSTFSVHIRLTSYGSLTASLVQFIANCLQCLPAPFIAHLLSIDMLSAQQYIPSFVQSNTTNILSVHTDDNAAPDTIQLTAATGSDSETQPSQAEPDDEDEDSDEHPATPLSPAERAEKDERRKQEAIQREIERIKKWAQELNIGLKIDGSRGAETPAPDAVDVESKQAEQQSEGPSAEVREGLMARLQQLEEREVALQEKEKQHEQKLLQQLEQQQEYEKQIQALAEEEKRIARKRMEIAAAHEERAKLRHLLHRSNSMGSKELRFFEDTATRNIERQRAIKQADLEKRVQSFEKRQKSLNDKLLGASDKKEAELEKKYDDACVEEEKKEIVELPVGPTAEELARARKAELDHQQQLLAEVKNFNPMAMREFMRQATQQVMSSNPELLVVQAPEDAENALAGRYEQADLKDMLDTIRQTSRVAQSKKDTAASLSLAPVHESEPVHSEEQEAVVQQTLEATTHIAAIQQQMAAGHMPTLTDYNSANSYDVLTGLPQETLQFSSLREQLMAAERKMEEAEMDDCYLRYLQPQLFTKEAKLERRRTRRQSTKNGSSMLESRGRSADGSRTRRRSTMRTPTKDTLSRQDSTLPDDIKESDDSPEKARARRRKSSVRRKTISTIAESTTANSSRRAEEQERGDTVADLPNKHGDLDSSDGLSSGRSDTGTGSGRSHSRSRSRSGSRRKSRSGHARRKSSKFAMPADKSLDSMIYFVDFDMEAENLDNPFMIGMPDPYVEVYRVRQYIWELIATTETHERSCNPHFGRIVVSVDQLCNMQLGRKILFKVWTNSRGYGSRHLIGECMTTLSTIQSNINFRFPIINATKAQQNANYKNSGYLRFNHAELAVNSTKGALAFPGPNVVDIANPVFKQLTQCVARLGVTCHDLPERGFIFKDLPNPHISIHPLLPQGEFAKDPIYVSPAQFQVTTCRFKPCIVSLHELCYGDINRLFRIKFKHEGSLLGMCDVTMRDVMDLVKSGATIPLTHPKDKQWYHYRYHQRYCRRRSRYRQRHCCCCSHYFHIILLTSIVAFCVRTFQLTTILTVFAYTCH